jgi:hypothetical protein
MTASPPSGSRLTRPVNIGNARLASQPFPAQQSIGRGDFAFASRFALVVGRAPDHIKNSREISQLDQDGADRCLYQGRPDLMRHEIGDDAEHDQDSDQSTKKEQEGHDYVPAPSTSGLHAVT